MRAVLFVSIVVLGLGCSGRDRTASRPAGSAAPAAGSAAAPAVARQLAEETAVRTASGAALRAPKGWWLTEEGGLVLLEDPERTLKAWLVEVREPDAARAIAAAWRRAAPGLVRGAAGAPDTPPPSGGWDAITTVSYDGGGGDRIVEATARRHGGVTYVALLDGDRAARSRRGPQLERALATLRPEGMRQESFAGRTPRPIDAARASELDDFIQDARARLGVPGAAVAVIAGGQVVYERAFGLRALGGEAPVTPQTLFLIGSITKSMTTMMQATLVDAGAFAWETPVVSVLPSFALGDPELTRQVAMWHMSCACTGMPRQDLEHIFEYDKISAEQRVASMSSMRPTTALGETFQYSNLMVMAGGYAAAHAYAPRRSLGDAYDAAMRRKIFEPIGMKATTLDFAAVRRADHARPHAAAIDGVVRPIPLAMERNVISIRPAGGVWSSLRDLERYVMTELAGGVAPDGRRVVSEVNLRARWSVRVGAVGGDDDDGGGDGGVGVGYGLGLGVGRYHGLSMLSHDGGAFGFGTSMFMLPEQGLGIIVLTNVRSGAPTEHLPFNVVVKRRVIEAIFEGARPRAAAQLAYFARGQAEAAARAVAQLPRALDPARLKQLAGTYTNASLGAVTLAAAPGGASFDAGEWRSAVGERTAAGGAVTLVFLDPPFAGAEVAVGGDEASPTLTVADGQLSYVFARAPARRRTGR